MTYYELNSTLIPQYLQSIEAMQNIFTSLDQLHIEEVGDGNLNFVYKITNKKQPNETVVLKQAVPYLRCVGNAWPLSKERMTFETMALEIQSELSPAYVPKVFFADKEMSLIIMQNLNRHKILRGEMNQGKVFPKLADHMSTFLARTIFYTSSWYMNSADKKESVKRFINKELCELTEKFIFTHPFVNAESNRYGQGLTQQDIDFIHQDKHLRIAVSEIRQRFMNHTDCLLHGDLHTGSMMVNEDETFVIDPEFAFYGPAGFDPGLLIGNLLLAYLAHAYRQKMLLKKEPAPYRQWILDTIEAIWNSFAEKFDLIWAENLHKCPDLFWNDNLSANEHKILRHREIRRIFHDTVGIAGCVMIRRTLGIAKASDITDIEDPQARAALDRLALRIGKRLIMEHENLSSIDDVISMAKEISPLTPLP